MYDSKEKMVAFFVGAICVLLFGMIFAVFDMKYNATSAYAENETEMATLFGKKESLRRLRYALGKL